MSYYWPINQNYNNYELIDSYIKKKLQASSCEEFELIIDISSRNNDSYINLILHMLYKYEIQNATFNVWRSKSKCNALLNILNSYRQFRKLAIRLYDTAGSSKIIPMIQKQTNLVDVKLHIQGGIILKLFKELTTIKFSGISFFFDGSIRQTLRDSNFNNVQQYFSELKAETLVIKGHYLVNRTTFHIFKGIANNTYIKKLIISYSTIHDVTNMIMENIIKNCNLEVIELCHICNVSSINESIREQITPDIKGIIKPAIYVAEYYMNY